MRLLLLLPLLILLPMASLAGNHGTDGSAAPQRTQRRAAQAASADPGERVFNANCGRCHRPPMTLPSQATGTVLMHMRVRARLSREDERLLLRFMAP